MINYNDELKKEKAIKLDKLKTEIEEYCQINYSHIDKIDVLDIKVKFLENTLFKLINLL